MQNKISIKIREMLTKDIWGIIALIIIGVLALKYLGDPRFKTYIREGFSDEKKPDPEPYTESSHLSPDDKTDGPAHILKDNIEVTRPYNVTGVLTQQQCYEQDGHIIPEKVGDYTQRTNNYIHTYPDSCSAPFKEMVGSFYAPREGAIGAPVPIGAKMPNSANCKYGQ